MLSKAVWVYFIITAVFTAWVWYYSSVHDKGDLLLYFNENRSKSLNEWNIFITQWAEEFSYVAVGVFFLLFRKRRWAIGIAGLGLLVTIVSYSLKTSFGEPRPVKYFKIINELCLLNPIPGVPEYLAHNSYPSGHTMSAFALFGFLSFISRRWELSVVFAFVSICIGLSRVYLNHHFIEDVGSGAAIGTILGWLVFAVDTRTRRQSSHWSESPLLNRKFTTL